MVADEDNNEPIPEDCVIYRIVSDPDDIKENGQPKSSAFSNSSPREGEQVEDCYMSVFFSDRMTAMGVTPEALLKWWGKPARLFTFTFSELKSFGEEVFREEIAEFPGHGGVRRQSQSKRSGGEKKRLAREARPYKADQDDDKD